MKSKSLFLVALCGFLLSACGSKSFDYHDKMVEKIKKDLDKTRFESVKKSYAKTLVDEKKVFKDYVSILEEKSLSEVLKELELINGKYYFLKSADIIIPSSRIKIYDFSELNSYLKAVLDKTIVEIDKDRMTLVKVYGVNERKRRSINKIPFKLNGQISVEELIKLITQQSGYEVTIGSYIKDRFKFQDSIISINSINLKNALDSLSSAKDVFVDVDYDKEMINIRRYKDTVIELNIPLLNIKSSNQTSSQETANESNIKNNSNIVLYEELNKMLKNIIANDKISTYHIDKASGLIFLKSTKSVERAVRTIAKAYEASFAKEATIEFERIEIALNKNRKYGISSALYKGKGTNTPFPLKEITAKGALNVNGDLKFKDINPNGLVKKLTGHNILGSQLNRLIDITAQANNGIGKILNYSKNVMVLKNNLPSVQSVSQNTEYISKIVTNKDENGKTTSLEPTVETLKDGNSILAMAKISRDSVFLNITPTIKKLLKMDTKQVGDTQIELPQYNEQSYNISREVALGETAIVGSIIVHDDSKNYEGILPLEGFIVGGEDSKKYVRREIIYVVTVKSIKGF